MKSGHFALCGIAASIAGIGVATAQTSTVTLYGRAALGLDNYQAKGGNCVGTLDCSLKGRMRVFGNGSRLGVRGTEDLGGGLRAVLQLESGVNADNGSNLGQGGQTNASAGFFASRDSFVGLEGGFGRVTFGRQSIWWSNGAQVQHSTNWINTQVPYWNGAQGRLSSGVTRQSNVLQYTTPSFGGFDATLSYSPDTGTTQGYVNSEAQQGGAKTDAKILGATLRGRFGPIGLQYDYSQRETISGLLNAATGNEVLNGANAANVGAAAGSFSVRPKSLNHKASVSWAYMPGAQVTLIATRLQANDWNATTTDDLRQSTMGVVWEHMFGNVQLLAQYGRSGKVSGCTGFVALTGTGLRKESVCDDSGSNSYTAAVRYLFSKRTSAHLSYNRVTNQKNQWADYTGGSYTSGPLSATVGRGADPTVIGFGIIHNF